MRTYVPKVNSGDKTWWVVDAEGQNLGRLATQIASVLRGKHRPEVTPHLDLGDHVIVVNAEKIEVTGNRLDDKTYHRHSGYPGGLRSMSLRDLLDRHPDRVVKLAVKGMLPRGRLGRKHLSKLRVYAGPDHPHTAQTPTQYTLAVPSRGADAS